MAKNRSPRTDFGHYCPNYNLMFVSVSIFSGCVVVVFFWRLFVYINNEPGIIYLNKVKSKTVVIIMVSDVSCWSLARWNEMEESERLMVNKEETLLNLSDHIKLIQISSLNFQFLPKDDRSLLLHSRHLLFFSFRCCFTRERWKFVTLKGVILYFIGLTSLMK